MQQDPATLADQLLATPDDEWPAWLAGQAAHLSLALIEALKQRIDLINRADPPAAERISRAAHAVAEYLPDDPLAVPLAHWMRGNWAVFTRPAEAVVCYHEALAGYERAGEAMPIARLSSNLVFAYTNLGRLAEAIAAAERAHRLLLSLGPQAEHYLINLGINYGWLLYECGRYAEALAANETAMALARRYEHYVQWAELQVNQAFTLGMVGQLSESEELLLDSREILVAQEQWLTVARIDLNLAELAGSLGRPAAALRRFRRAREAFEALDVIMEYASVWLFEAELLVRLGAFREAFRVYDQARERFARDEMPQYVARALLAGAVARRSHDPTDPRSVPMLAKAAAIFERIGMPLSHAETDLERAALALDLNDDAAAAPLLNRPLPANAPPALTARAHLLRGRLATLLGNTNEALTLFTEALRISRAAALIWLQREVHGLLGRHLAAHEPAVARSHLETAAQIDETIRAELSVEELTAAFHARRGDVLPLLVRLAVAEKQPLEALRTAWRWNGGPLLDLLATHAERKTDPITEPARLEPLRQQVTMLRWQLARAVQEDETPATIESLQARLRELEQHTLDQRRHLRQGTAGRPYSLPAGPREILARLDADRLIEYVRCGGDLLALCADRYGNCTATWLGPLEAVQDRLSRLELKNLNFLRLSPEQRRKQSAPLIRAMQPILQQLHTILLAPLPNLPPAGRLLIAPCAPLHLAPFAAFWDGNHYLVERYETELIPSGALLAAPTPPAGPLGPPLVIGASAEGALGAVAVEVAAVAAALPDCASYLDDPAALDHLIGLTEAPQVLHVSAHTELDLEPSIFSSLQLAGAMLTIERCYDLCLAGTELVVLNGCSTATGMESGGALLAFQSALLVAGARRVLGSLWPVQDELAARLMATFYRSLETGQPPANALRAAQCDLLQQTETAHPAVWAAFAVTRR